MADKQNVAKRVRNAQKKVESKQKSAVGLNDNFSSEDINRSPIIELDKTPEARNATMELQGEIEIVERLLDKDSLVKEDYEKMKKHNQEFLNSTDL